MAAEWQDVGIGGAIALFIIREVLTFLRTRRNGHSNGSSGDRSVEFWRENIRESVIEVVDSRLMPILAEMRQEHRVVAEILRERTHETNNLLQRLVLLAELRFGIPITK